jgi:hypothetical protein
MKGERSAWRRNDAPTVETTAPRGPRLHLHADGDDHAIGSVAAPLASWAEVLERLRALYAGGHRAATVRVLCENYPHLRAVDRSAIADLEKLGMRLHFEAPDSFVRAAALMKGR